MFPLIERYLERDTTQKAFAAEHGLSTSLLNYWLAKYRREQAESQQEPPSAPDESGSFDFIEITPGSLPAEQALLEVIYPHGVRLRLFSPVEAAYLERLVGLGGPAA